MGLLPSRRTVTCSFDSAEWTSDGLIVSFTAKSSALRRRRRRRHTLQLDEQAAGALARASRRDESEPGIRAAVSIDPPTRVHRAPWPAAISTKGDAWLHLSSPDGAVWDLLVLDHPSWNTRSGSP
jgi:hypothetical protein